MLSKISGNLAILRELNIKKESDEDEVARNLQGYNISSPSPLQMLQNISYNLNSYQGNPQNFHRNFNSNSANSHSNRNCLTINRPSQLNSHSESQNINPAAHQNGNRQTISTKLREIRQVFGEIKKENPRRDESEIELPIPSSPFVCNPDNHFAQRDTVNNLNRAPALPNNNFSRHLPPSGPIHNVPTIQSSSAFESQLKQIQNPHHMPEISVQIGNHNQFPIVDLTIQQTDMALVTPINTAYQPQNISKHPANISKHSSNVANLTVTAQHSLQNYTSMTAEMDSTQYSGFLFQQKMISTLPLEFNHSLQTEKASVPTHPVESTHFNAHPQYAQSNYHPGCNSWGNRNVHPQSLRPDVLINLVDQNVSGLKDQDRMNRQSSSNLDTQCVTTAPLALQRSNGLGERHMSNQLDKRIQNPTVQSKTIHCCPTLTNVALHPAPIQQASIPRQRVNAHFTNLHSLDRNSERRVISNSSKQVRATGVGLDIYLEKNHIQRQDLNPRLPNLRPQLQNVHPQLPNVYPQLSNVHPELQNVNPHLQNSYPNLRKSNPQLQNVNPHLQNLDPKLQNVHSQRQNLSSQLRKEHSQLQNVQPPLQKSSQQSQNLSPQLPNVHAQRQNLIPQLQNSDPQLQNLDPKLRKENPQLQNVQTQLQKSSQQSQNLSPQLQKVRPQRKHLDPQLQNLSPQLQNMYFQLQNLSVPTRNANRQNRTQSQFPSPNHPVIDNSTVQSVPASTNYLSYQMNCCTNSSSQRSNLQWMNANSTKSSERPQTTSELNPEPLLKCKYCEATFKSTDSTLTHMRECYSTKLKKMLEKCEICGLDRQEYRTHCRHKEINFNILMHAEIFYCDYDGRIYENSYRFLRHMDSHLIVYCPICDKELKKTSVEIHIRDVHKTEKNFHCELCPAAFKNRSGLTRHINRHNKNFECKICGKRFPTNFRLKDHFNYYHSDDDNVKVRCGICLKNFSRKSALRLHLKIHDKTTAKTFKCDRCDYGTNILRSFQQHQRSHVLKEQRYAEIENPVKCSKCPAHLRDENALKHHMMNVHPKDVYECDLCGRIIRAKSNLMKHIRIHIKNFEEKGMLRSEVIPFR